MPGVVEQREHHERSQERQGKRAASPNHGKSGYGPDNRGEVGEDAGLGHAASGSIRVGAAPGEDGDAIDNEIASTNEPTTQSAQDREDKERFWQRRLCAISLLPLL